MVRMTLRGEADKRGIDGHTRRVWLFECPAGHQIAVTKAMPDALPPNVGCTLCEIERLADQDPTPKKR